MAPPSPNNTPTLHYITPGVVAKEAAQQKMTKYASLASTYIFCPAAIETASAWNAMVVKIAQEIGRSISVITEESRITTLS